MRRNILKEYGEATHGIQRPEKPRTEGGPDGIGAQKLEPKSCGHCNVRDRGELGKRGNVQTIANAVGHVTTITAYDLNGRPLSISDPDGLATALTYHPRGWLVSRQVGTELTSYTYDGVGQLTKVTLPDSSYVQYTYDGAHRLTQINDGLGNKIVYTLDAMGKRIKEEAFDPSNMLARTRQQIYDSLNRLHQSVGAQ
jgi:YD repeat-containing protein